MGGCARIVNDGGISRVVVGVDWKENTTHSSDPSSRIMHMSVNIGKEVGTTIILDNFFDGYIPFLLRGRDYI